MPDHGRDVVVVEAPEEGDDPGARGLLGTGGEVPDHRELILRWEPEGAVAGPHLRGMSENRASTSETPILSSILRTSSGVWGT